MLNYKVCAEGYETKSKECTDYRDDGYETCSKWGSQCRRWAKHCVVSWIPFIGPAICKVFEWLCTLSEWVCVAFVWVSNWVCHAWNIITTFVCLVWETVLVAAAVVAVFVKFVFAIPIIGPILKYIVNIATFIAFGFIGLIVEGIGCGLFGICIAKKLRVCVVIAHDGRDYVATAAQIQPILDQVTAIYKAAANIDVTIFVNDKGKAPNVEPSCDAGAWFDDLGLVGSQFEESATLNCMEYSAASIIGIGSPIYAFAVRDVKGTSNGCSLGPLTNYVVFEAGTSCGGNTHLAHELGHACGLPHKNDTKNLMHPNCVTPRNGLTELQKAVVRGSKYVTYF